MYSSPEHSLQEINFTPGKVPKCYVCELKAPTKTGTPIFYFMRPQGWFRYEKGLWNARSKPENNEKEGIVREMSPPQCLVVNEFLLRSHGKSLHFCTQPEKPQYQHFTDQIYANSDLALTIK
jgi:hypothetical protein